MRVVLTLAALAALAALPAALCLEYCGTAPRTNAVHIVRAELTRLVDDRDLWRLSVEISNETTEVVYVYDSIQTIDYDDANQRTVLRLRPKPPDPAPSDPEPMFDTGTCHFVHLPSAHVIRSFQTARFEIRVPHSFRQLVTPNPWTTSLSLDERDVPVAKARQLVVEIAWSDQPFVVANTARMCWPERSKAMTSLQRGILSSEVARR